MSFSNLKSTRQSKHSQSFVSESVAGSSSQDSNVIPEAAEVPSEAQNTGAESVNLDGLHQLLPHSFKISKSSEAGRGIFSKRVYKAGMFLP